MALLAGTALAVPPELRSETLLQLRSDPLGGTFMGGLQTLGGTASFGQTHLEGYGDLGYASGFDQAFAGELYVLAAEGEAGPLTWTVGRQPLLLPTWSRRLDGGTLTWAVDRRLSVSAAAGLASQSGAPGTFDGEPVARVSGAWTRGGARAGAGVWGEGGVVPAAHADLEARFGSATAKRAPEVGLLGAAGIRAGVATLERGRIEAGLLPGSGVRVLGWFEHREGLADDRSALAPAILSTFAPDGSDAVGLAAGVSTKSRARLWASGSVQRWSPSTDAEPVTGLLGELRWDPSCGPERWCLRPSWQVATGNAGAYHRSGGIVSMPLPSVLELDLHAAWVPYREPHLDWRSAWVTGGTARVVASSGLAVEAGADLLLDGVRPETRGWLAVQLRAGGIR